MTESTYHPIAVDQPLTVAAGPITLTIARGALRWAKLGDVEIIHGIYGTVRSAGWGTIESCFESCEAAIGDGAFGVRFRAQCVSEPDGIDFAWAGAISGSRDGTVRFDFDGVARRPFLAARVGLCVLHPLRLAGRPVEVTTLFGRLRGSFPDLVTGYMPFTNMLELRQDIGRGHEARIDFTGDVFQMEDQRAFSDASFKTFSRPLELPQPFMVDPGSRVRQSITLTVPRHRPSRRPVAATARGARRASLVLGTGTGRSFPAVGAGLAPVDVAMHPEVARAVRAMGLAHLRAEITVGDAGASAALDRAITAARSADCAIEAVLLTRPTDPGLERLLAEIAASAVPVARIVAIDPEGHATPPALAARARSALQAVGIDAPLCGGSRGYLYQLVAQGVPADLVDEVVFPTNPQVHTFDEASIMETLDTLPVMARTAAALVAGKPVVVGPVSLKAFVNPDRAGPELPPVPGTLPDRYDRRQTTRFAAAWTLGSVAALAHFGVAAMTLHEAAGWAGLVAASHRGLPEMPVPSGTPLPVGAVVAALAPLRGAELVEAEVPPGWTATAVQLASNRVRVLVANVGPEPGRIAIDVGRQSEGHEGRVLVVDENGGGRWEPQTRRAVVDLVGYGVAMLDARLG